VLRARLAVWGAELLPDGAVVQPGADGLGAASARARRTLVLGGARSGKSVAAERLLAAEPDVTYVATASRPADDAEWHDRIAAHRARRPASWSTIESADVAGMLHSRASTDPPLLVDCITVWLARVMDDAGVWTATDEVSAKNADATVGEAVDALVLAWRTTSARIVAVTNEVGSGVVPEYASGRRFRDELGSLNARLAADADDVILVTAGIAHSLRPIRPGSA
jgi:adenosylcobinamide kinase/adenosylcobinamide-phosphate guanylyltransferase